jgi:SDR family mycofactocin-dependent oxidoreductase
LPGAKTTVPVTPRGWIILRLGWEVLILLPDLTRRSTEPLCVEIDGMTLDTETAAATPPPRQEVAGRVALVTGGARGFGRAVALLLASEGADVAVLDRAEDLSSDRFYPMSSLDDLDGTVEEISKIGRRALAIRGDVTSADDCRRAAEAVFAELGRIDILVANAGIWSLAKTWEFTEEEWDLTVDVNLKGAWLAARAVIPRMIEQRYGKIVFVSSIAGLRAYPDYAAYIAAKQGVVGLAKTLAIELGEYRINVNAVCPTQMGKPTVAVSSDPVWEKAVGHPNPTAEEFEAAFAAQHALPYLGIPAYEDVAQSVLWLVSERARLITGHALPVDAGWMAMRGG